MTTNFQSPAIETFWNNLRHSLDRIEEVYASCSLDQLNWRPPAPETNSIHVLAVHSLGHLRQGIVGVLGEGSQERDRDAEFRAVATTANAPIPDWAETHQLMETTLARLSPDVLDRVYEPINRAPMTGLALMMLMTRHTALHEGHAELTRDLAKAAGVS